MKTLRALALGLIISGTALGTAAAQPPPPKTPATVTPDAEWFSMEESAGTFICPDNKAIIGRRATIAVSGIRITHYRCARLTFNGITVPLGPVSWSLKWENNASDPCNAHSSRECRHTYVCPDNKVMVGRFHEDEERGHTTYGCAQATTAPGVFPEGGWHVIKFEDNDRPGEGEHEFQCPTNTVMIGRYHRDDEEVGYACGYLLPGSSETAGSIGFRHYQSKQPCFITAPRDPSGATWTYFLSYIKPYVDDAEQIADCSSNVFDSIELKGVQSATTILLTDDQFCRKSGNFWIEMKTTRNPTSFDTLGLPELLKSSKGQIISGTNGLRLIDFHHNFGTEITRALSCIQIRNSAAPPQ